MHLVKPVEVKMVSQIRQGRIQLNLKGDFQRNCSKCEHINIEDVTMLTF